MRNSNFKVSIILPALNESLNIHNSFNKLSEIIKPITDNFEIIFVNDGSTDNSLEILKDLNKNNSKLKYLNFSRNYGEQQSLMAGLNHATGDLIISMDADLQHPPSYIPQMIEEWRKGYDIIVMRRKDVGHNSFIKKFTEIAFYHFLTKFSDTPIFFRFSGYCLLDRKAIEALKQYNELEPFLRGLIGHIGFKVKELEYTEEARKFGVSNYNLTKLIKLAITGMTSFSAFPLYMSFYAGLIAIFLSSLYIIFALINYYRYGGMVPGWISTIIVIVFFGGIQLISLGVLGIYISKIFIQSKGRPLYIINEKSDF